MEIGPSSNHYHYGSEHFLTITNIDALRHYFTPDRQLLKRNLHPPFCSLLQLCQPNTTQLFSSSSFSCRIITSFFLRPLFWCPGVHIHESGLLPPPWTFPGPSVSLLLSLTMKLFGQLLGILLPMVLIIHPIPDTTTISTVDTTACFHNAMETTWHRLMHSSSLSKMKSLFHPEGNSTRMTWSPTKVLMSWSNSPAW